MKTLLLCVLTSMLFVSALYGQHFIGLGIDEIKTEMQKEKKNFLFSKEVNTGKYHFLKFETIDETQTMLFLLDDKGKCKFTKLMCDYSLLKTFEDSLNKNYEYQKNMSWIDEGGDENYNYVIELEKKDWFFTIKTTRKKK
ncbi:MAG: hypothetical protein ACLFNL_02560 [Bacteroidales bacterium]